MKWVYGIRRKISAAMLLAAIFLLLFLKNMMDSKNVSQLGTSFSSVYEDRLLVESYIYRMSEHLFRKKIVVDTAESASDALQVRPLVKDYNRSIDEIVAAYGETKLTREEGIYFKEFKQNIARLAALENEYFQQAENSGKLDETLKRRIDAQFNQASNNLDRLSRIQISEGKILNESTQRIVADSSILTHFETGILIAIGLMVLVLVFESTSLLEKTAHKQSLN